jgi:hypothetical protein
MGRDDSILWSGSSSSSFGITHEQKIRVDKREEKKEQRGKLQPAADIVFTLIQKEMDKAMYLPTIDIKNSPDERMFMIEAMSRQKYVGFLKELSNKLDIILREPKVILEDEEVEEDE